MSTNQLGNHSSVASELLRDAMAPRFTQEQIAEHLGVTQQTVSSWVKGRTKPSADAMAKLEDLIGIPMRKWAEPVPETESQKATGTDGAG